MPLSFSAVVRLSDAAYGHLEMASRNGPHTDRFGHAKDVGQRYRSERSYAQAGIAVSQHAFRSRLRNGLTR